MASLMGKTVVNGETGEVYMIKDSDKTIYLMSNEEISSAADKLEEPETIKLDETKNILGYKCTKYKQTNMMEGFAMPQILWVTDKLKTPDYEGNAFKGMAGQGTMNFDVEGFPMLVEIEMPGAPFSMKMEVTNIEFGDISKSEFKKPSDYAVKPFSEMNPF